MMKKQELMQRAAVLRQYEVFGYQVAYFLLEDEALAREGRLGRWRSCLRMTHSIIILAPFSASLPSSCA